MPPVVVLVVERGLAHWTVESPDDGSVHVTPVRLQILFERELLVADVASVRLLGAVLHLGVVVEGLSVAEGHATDVTGVSLGTLMDPNDVGIPRVHSGEPLVADRTSIAEVVSD